ncbi:HpcH/HpaI aldolase/citrate lyase family protein [Nocardia jejuensis]|uniref:HpcH/HpaI aldolase/citrate lyase family protein n=1 Tax=Nocardia jejuensis TaxID=328049 RepID=UPI000833ED0A|nr:CoA ester lyase [Nocardia jejuensis]
MRSALYVPGNRPDLFDKAVAGPADVILIDLEDSVPLADKESARAEVGDWLRGFPGPARGIWVRINPGELGRADLNAVAQPAVTAICLAKTESAQQVRQISTLLDEHGRRAAEIRLCALLESAAALFAAREIAAAPRIARLQLGEADLRADAGISPGPDEREMLYARSHVVLASAAAGIDAPLAPVSTDFTDLAALRHSTKALARLGFRGRACIHPNQVPIVNEIFTPSATELARARAVIERFEAAQGGVVLDAEGRMVDLAVIRQARRLLR